MAYATETLVKYRIQVSEIMDGRWVQVYRTGLAKVLEFGFQMQLGQNGYNLEVVSDNDGAWTTGTTVRAFNGSVSRA